MIGKWLCVIGIGFIIVGLTVLALSKVGITLGKLPGDVSFHSGRTSIYFPITTSIVISIVLSILLSLWYWLFTRK